MPEAWLLTTVVFQVPLIPLLDMAGKVGGVLPWQIAEKAVKSGTFIGFDNFWPVNTVFISPLKSKIKLL